MSFPLFLWLNGNSILSFNSWRVSTPCVCIPKDDPRGRWGSSDGDAGGNLVFTSVLGSIWVSRLVFVTWYACVSSDPVFECAIMFPVRPQSFWLYCLSPLPLPFPPRPPLPPRFSADIASVFTVPARRVQ